MPTAGRSAVASDRADRTRGARRVDRRGHDARPADAGPPRQRDSPVVGDGTVQFADRAGAAWADDDGGTPRPAGKANVDADATALVAASGLIDKACGHGSSGRDLEVLEHEIGPLTTENQRSVCNAAIPNIGHVHRPITTARSRPPNDGAPVSVRIDMHIAQSNGPRAISRTSAVAVAGIKSKTMRPIHHTRAEGRPQQLSLWGPVVQSTTLSLLPRCSSGSKQVEGHEATVPRGPRLRHGRPVGLSWAESREAELRRASRPKSSIACRAGSRVASQVSCPWTLTMIRLTGCRCVELPDLPQCNSRALQLEPWLPLGY